MRLLESPLKMKNKIIKLSLSIPFTLAIFYAPNVFASASLDGTLRTPNDGSAINQVSCSNIQSNLPNNDFVLSLYDEANVLIATSSPLNVSLAGATYNGGAEPHHNYHVGGTFLLTTTPTLSILKQYRVAFSPYMVCDSVLSATYSAPSPITLAFQYPVDSTSMATDFSSFQIVATNPSSVAVQGASLEVEYSRNSDFSNSLTVSDLITHQIAVSSSSVIYILKNQALYSNSVYYARVRNLGTNVSSSISWSTGLLSFTENTNAPIPPVFATSSSAGYVSVNSSFSPFFVDCSAYDNIPLFASGTIGGIFCNAKKTAYAVAEWFLVPPDFASSYWSNSLDSIKQVPPFSLVVATVNSFQASAGLVATSTPDYSELNLTLPGGYITDQAILSSNMLLNWLTTDDCNQACAQEKKDTFFSYFSAIVWLGAGIKILTFIF